MNKLAFLAVAAPLLGIVIAAHAAPSGAETALKSRPGIGPTPALALVAVKAEVLPGTGRCGEPVKEQVRLTNKTAKSWVGTVSFAGPQGTRDFPNLSIGSNESKVVDVSSSTNLDCSKPLGPFGIKIWNEGGPSSVWFTKAIKPMAVKTEQGFQLPNNKSPWLRRLWLDGKCGGTLSGKMGLHTTSLSPQMAKIKLTLGAATKEDSVQVLSSNTFVTVETPLDCLSPTGIPSLEYALVDGNPTSGTLKPVVEFAPDP